MPDTYEARAFFYKKAMAGEAGFAIAYALLEAAVALDRMGLNYGDQASTPGALEMIGMQLGEVSKAFGGSDATALLGKD